MNNWIINLSSNYSVICIYQYILICTNNIMQIISDVDEKVRKLCKYLYISTRHFIFALGKFHVGTRTNRVPSSKLFEFLDRISAITFIIRNPHNNFLLRIDFCNWCSFCLFGRHLYRCIFPCFSCFSFVFDSAEPICGQFL